MKKAKKSGKKMLTRQQFEETRIDLARKMAADKRLLQQAIKTQVMAGKYTWLWQANWFGEPVLRFPQDMFAAQEIIYKTRPEYIIETGVAWGGSLLFYSTIMEAIGGNKVIGVDIYIPQDLRKRISSHGQLSRRIILIKGSSTEHSTISKVRKIIGRSKKVLVILDSNHTHDHVLKELSAYSKLLSKGNYIICEDTAVEDMPVQKNKPRPWGPGNNPKTAVRQFLTENSNFKVDKLIENKLLFTSNPDGYLVHK